MFCTHCGRQVCAEDRFCGQCGAAQSPTVIPVPARRLYRPRSGRMLGGVAAGLAHYLDLDVTLIRIALVALMLFSCGLVVVGYIIAWILMPEEPLALIPPAPAAAAVARPEKQESGV